MALGSRSAGRLRTLVIGGAGQLGRAICRALEAYDVVAPEHGQLDITRAESTDEALQSIRPQLVINTAAFHDVPRCEQHGERAFRVNTLGARHLARATERVGARLLHLSSDYVFDGRAGRPYREEDVAQPLNLYGETKLAGERQVRLHNPASWIVRTTGLFGPDACRAKPNGRNFVGLMLHLAATLDEVKVVHDVRCCPTYVDDLARQLRVMVEAEAPFGVYHAVNPGGGSWFDFASAIFAAAKVQPRKLTAVDHTCFADPVPRPLDSRLAVDKLQALGMLELRPLQEALTAYLAGGGGPR
jgi:dTDP-4-dehydrorhamnose reductase